MGLTAPARIAPATAAQKKQYDDDEKQGVHVMSFRLSGLRPKPLVEGVTRNIPFRFHEKA